MVHGYVQPTVSVVLAGTVFHCTLMPHKTCAGSALHWVSAEALQEVLRQLGT